MEKGSRGGLNENGFYRLIYLNVCPQWVACLGKLKYGLIGEGMSLGVGFEVSKAHTRSNLFPLPPSRRSET